MPSIFQSTEIIEFLVVIITTIVTSLIVLFKSKKFKDLKNTVDYQLTNNGGGSLIDKVDTIVKKLDEIVLSVSRLEVWKTAWMELSDSPIFIANKLGRFVWVNNEYLRTTGSTFQDIEGQGWMKVIHADDRERVLSEWRLAVDSTTTYESIYRIINIQNNTIKTVHCKAKPLIRDGVLAGFIGIWDFSLAQ